MTPAPSHWLPKWRERFEERAAILEFDANLDRVSAEMRALAMTKKEMEEDERRATLQP